MPISFSPAHAASDREHALFQIAREHYVGARTALVASAAFTAQLAMQQSIETAFKALIVAAEPQRRFGGAKGHRLRDLLNEVAANHSSLAKLFAGDDASRVLDVLGRRLQRDQIR
jgi:HEPN domain-containing protein